MRISVITPSFRSSAWLKLCIASVADQGVDVEHIVQDSCSNDGTQDWLPQDTRVKAFIEKDSGMYDAVNRGLRRSTGDILAYLNCDEQYLPGALKTVIEYFKTHPDVDVAFGDCVVVDEKGDYICSRRMQLPQKSYVTVAHLSTFSCATFFRRSVIERGFFFDTKWRDVGDADWVLQLLEAKVPMGLLRQFTSTFADIGHNMGLGPNAQKEKLMLRQSTPWIVRRMRPVIIARYQVRRLFRGDFFQGPLEYSLYTSTSPGRRVRHQIDKPKALWRYKSFLKLASNAA
jgi:glycosyltransferase involved in cell wall biosynthesis